MSVQGNNTLIASDEALATFRQGLSGAYALELLEQASGRLLIQLPVGVGKSEWLSRIIVHALKPGSPYDLVVVLVPRWDILEELLQRLPPELPRTILQPRPRMLCGDLDELWTEYENTGCSLLAKEQVCKFCPHRLDCTWPEQYGSQLRGARLILGTQQHLAINPQFIHRLCQPVGAERPLILLDESNFLVRSVERTIARQDMERFAASQQLVVDNTHQPSPSVQSWLGLTQLVSQAPTEDLCQGLWRFPHVGNEWATQVQKAGRHQFGVTFRFLGFDLHHFAHADPVSRERLTNGDIQFAAPTYLGKDFIIFSGSMAKELARYRLDPNHAQPSLVSPFEYHHFEHSETHWYNLNMLDGAACYFPKNAERILDFFAQKILRNIQAGKRTLLVARKKFVVLCRTQLLQRLTELGATDIKIVTKNWKKYDLTNPRVLPLINYGVAGLNCFQHCEAAYCLTSYYVSAQTLAKAVSDMDPTIDRYPITIDCSGNPRQRHARVQLPDDRQTILPHIAEAVLEQQEADVVVQAVGRVRPFTRPREIITFQTGLLPGVCFSLQFQSLAQARYFFGIGSAKEADMVVKSEQASRLKAQGRTKKQIAKEMSVSVSTVKRYIKAARGSKSLN